MTQVKIKRVYEDPESIDGYRVFVDRLWPRGMKKEALHYDLLAKDITPSPEIRQWFHQDPDVRWHEFVGLYRKELNGSEAAKAFVNKIRQYPVVTLLYASKNPDHNHALILKDFLDENMKSQS